MAGVGGRKIPGRGKAFFFVMQGTSSVEELSSRRRGALCDRVAVRRSTQRNRSCARRCHAEYIFCRRVVFEATRRTLRPRCRTPFHPTQPFLCETMMECNVLTHCSAERAYSCFAQQYHFACFGVCPLSLGHFFFVCMCVWFSAGGVRQRVGAPQQR